MCDVLFLNGNKVKWPPMPGASSTSFGAHRAMKGKGILSATPPAVYLSPTRLCNPLSFTLGSPRSGDGQHLAFPLLRSSREFGGLREEVSYDQKSSEAAHHVHLFLGNYTAERGHAFIFLLDHCCQLAIQFWEKAVLVPPIQ